MMLPRVPSHRYAFSLVELSIVLVILGLLVGGVLSGQSLIHAAQLRSVGEEYNKHLTAINSFKDKYFALPGDMNNATKFWGVAAPAASCQSTVSTGTETCDGDGSGTVDGWPVANGEEFRFWQHLANAGMIEGHFTGTSTATEATPANSPVSKYNNDLWYITHAPIPITAAPYVFDGTYGNYFQFGAEMAADAPYNPGMTAEDAWNVDTKLDDGKPATGKIVVDCAALADCTDTSDSTNMSANYLLSASGLTTSLQFRNLF